MYNPFRDRYLSDEERRVDQLVTKLNNMLVFLERHKALGNFDPQKSYSIMRYYWEKDKLSPKQERFLQFIHDQVKPYYEHVYHTIQLEMNQVNATQNPY